ncbi:anthranilate synthase component II [Eisenibacter elegans]|uniref:anthranilate synthase component II n=1 Tax=Eisenibacter elegans TaxID=997 RepID=UPI000421B39B|nr:aminodeoxychorismate/anthranilate synthase component II [Eisenibacter elegans]
MRLLLLDNYDSFTYNLLQILEQHGRYTCYVAKNDRISLETVALFDKIILSPGPGVPAEAGIMLPLITQYAPQKPILGVCLGHQAVGEVFGARLYNTDTIYHGEAHPLQHNGQGFFKGLPNPMPIGLYHSWLLHEEGFPHDLLDITARTPDGRIMAIQHKHYPVSGVQFHPESIMTPEGKQLLFQWLDS